MPKLQIDQNSSETPALSLTPRLTVSELAAILRLTRRGVQSAAAAGRLPGAARIGKLWTFDQAKIERFIAERERAVVDANAAYARTRRPDGCEPPLSAMKAEKAYQRAISGALGRSAKPGPNRPRGPKRSSPKKARRSRRNGEMDMG
jgi:Helix-turn-helix domain